ncbi:primosomal protein N' [Micavibrio aeruginosavorus]|uniref:Replication restart protein PriA n=1 Tax=Micavibrio aeruginosavorus (strain ARL-13) TaxID=856793 RepID=G2KPA2_MICAA|nr:primosomal protein N' [Micavibrio aeruginosavorus]AEP09003.1 primosomal protein N' [Micavibrio aeruginosavorus ARL-13]
MQTLFESMEEKAPPGGAPVPETARRVLVLVPYPVDRAYTYAVPDGMDVSPGDYVTVPLGKREVPGVVWGTSDEDVPPKKLKMIVDRFDLPPMQAAHRDFLSWVAQYTMSAPGAVLKMCLSAPAGLEPPKATTGYVLNDWVRDVLAHSPHLNPPPSRRGEEGQRAMDQARELRKDMTDAETRLWFCLSKDQLGHKFRRQHPIPPYVADFACIEKNLIIEVDGGQHNDSAHDEKRTAFLNSLGWRVLRFWNNEVLENIDGVLQTIITKLAEHSPPPSARGEDQGGGRAKLLRNLNPQRRKILEALSDGHPRRASEITDMAGCTPGVIKTMVGQGLLRTVNLFSSAPCRNPDIDRVGPDLSPDQRATADHLIAQVKSGEHHTSLLDGVTGAGKTEVYFEAIAEAVRSGKQGLILLPEIALSNAFLDRFKKRFGCIPALWHSHLTPAQRRTTWRGVADGTTKVVVGARSALFLPYQDLGIIVVDEEHDPAYKQEDGVIYHARDMAVVRGHRGKIPVVLVSATPSLETILNAWNGKYDHLVLPVRHGGAEMPHIDLIDMRADKPARQHFIAPTLHNEIQSTLDRGEQVLLFLNRRGYAPLTLCRTCGHRFECPRCTAWLVEHKKTSRLHCHHCGFATPIPKECPSCHDTDSLAACGPGVERIKEEVAALWPDARTVILASDIVDTNDKLKAVLDDIRERRIDIVIGTQIIAKGHHFPHLTLVGVIDADLGLGGGDLRAAERTFQLLHQVAGRAGREELKGHVFLQTFMPENKVMRAMAADDRDEFLAVEAEERERALMPPYSRLAGIIVSGRDEKQVMETARALGACAPQGPDVLTLGPAEAPFYRLRGNFRRRLLVRAAKTINLQRAIETWVASVKIPSTVRVQVDIDPQSFL